MALGAVVLAASHVCAKAAIVRIGMSALLLWRAVAALAVSLPLLPWCQIYELNGVAVAHVAVAVLLSPILLNLLFFVGLKTGDVGVQNALRQNSPLAVVLANAVFLAVPIGPWQWAGMVAIGVGTVVLARDQGKLGRSSAVIAGLFAAMAHGGSIVAQAYAIRHVNQYALIVIQNAAFVMFIGLLALARPTSRWAMRESLRDPAHRRGVVYAALSGVGINLIFDLLKVLAIPHLGTPAVACLVLLNLPVTVLLGVWLFRERPGRWALVGVGTVLAGALVLAATSAPAVPTKATAPAAPPVTGR
jgi:drug/metabolite transporter (DMT)-like permease